MSLPTADNNTPGFRPEVPSNSTAELDKTLPGPAFQASWLDGAALAALRVAAHLDDPSDSKSSFMLACRNALLPALASGPCSMAHARKLADLESPEDVDGRAAGAAVAALFREGVIEPAGWFGPSPWRDCHASPSRVWRLSTRTKL